MSYLDLEQEFDRAVIFLGEATAGLAEWPRAFVLHSIRVGLSLQHAGYDRETVLAGFLHDAVEDAGAAVQDLEARFGRRVAQLVEANTEDNTLARLDRPHEVINRCRQLGREALLVKAADLEDNLAFYLGEANREMLGWLAGLLDHFLSTSSSAIGSEAVWKSLSTRRREVLGMMDSQ